MRNPNPTDLKEQLDDELTLKELIRQLLSGVSVYELNLSEGVTWGIDPIDPDEATTKILQLFQQYAEEIIGNDTVPYTSDTPSNKLKPIYKSKNSLRAEQRKRLKLISKDSDE